MRQPSSEQLVLSIDPGYDRIGWAVSNRSGGNFQFLACGCIQTESKADIFDRYQQIEADLQEIIDKFKPAEGALETVFFSKNRKTAIRVSEARGIIIGIMLRNKIALEEYNPGEIKLAVTGYGNADKQAVAKMVRMQTGLSTGKLIDDAIDAVAVGMTHALTHNLRRTKAALNKPATS